MSLDSQEEKDSLPSTPQDPEKELSPKTECSPSKLTKSSQPSDSCAELTSSTMIPSVTEKQVCLFLSY